MAAGLVGVGYGDEDVDVVVVPTGEGVGLGDEFFVEIGHCGGFRWMDLLPLML